MKDLKYLNVGCSWPSVMDLGYDEVVKLLIDGQRYRALRGHEGFLEELGWTPALMDTYADRIIAEQTK